MRRPTTRPTARGAGRTFVAAGVLATLLAAGCASGGPGRTALPDFPRVEGPPSLYVAYPDSLQRVAVTDSNFIFGTTGTGAAELTVNGRPVEVNPNGSFLAFLPVPPPAAGDTAVYRLVARADGRADTVEHRILLPGVPEAREGVWVDTASAAEAERWLRAGETVELDVRAAPGLRAWVEVAMAVDSAAPHVAAPEDTPGGAGLPPDTAEAGAEPADTLGGAVGPPDTVDAAAGPAEDTLDVPSADTADAPGRLALREAAPGRYRVELPAGELRRRAARAAAADRPTARDTATADSLPPADTAARDTLPPADTAVARPDTLSLRFVVTDGRDTAAVEERMPLLIVDPGRPPLATLSEQPDTVHGQAGAVVGRPWSYGSYAWRLPPGSAAPADRRLGGRVRLRLGPDLHAWVTAEDLRVGGPVELPPGEAVPTGVVGSVEARGRPDRLRLRVPVGRRLPAAVRPVGPRTLELTVHGGLGGTERMDYGPADGLLRSLAWEQLPGPRWRLRVRLTRRLWGWHLRWEDLGDPPPTAAAEDAPSPGAGDRPERDATPVAEPWTDPEPPPTDSARHAALPEPGSPGVLVLDVRRPPAPDRDEPLRGIRIAVDPGHPPVGAEGPTGLEEAEANLGVSRQLVRLLREAGAEPVLVRSDPGAVGLYERRRRSRAAAAHVLVSIHNNALPDGLRPYGREGTSTYYFHAHARPLAAAIQEGMLASMGLRDLGLHWGNLALPRESWMPSVLTEGAFMMIPRHEAALRTESFREAYARGVMNGVRRFLREVAAEAARDRGG